MNLIFLASSGKHAMRGPFFFIQDETGANAYPCIRPLVPNKFKILTVLNKLNFKVEIYLHFDRYLLCILSYICKTEHTFDQGIVWERTR